jgi:putative cell wall-binding protein
VLLVRPDELPEVTAAELVRLAPSRIIVLGGTSAVSEAVAEAAVFSRE